METHNFSYNKYLISMESYALKSTFKPPKTRASKIVHFKHYTTDAPI